MLGLAWLLSFGVGPPIPPYACCVVPACGGRPVKKCPHCRKDFLYKNFHRHLRTHPPRQCEVDRSENVTELLDFEKRGANIDRRLAELLEKDPEKVVYSFPYKQIKKLEKLATTPKVCELILIKRTAVESKHDENLYCRLCGRFFSSTQYILKHTEREHRPEFAPGLNPIPAPVCCAIRGYVRTYTISGSNEDMTQFMINHKPQIRDILLACLREFGGVKFFIVLNVDMVKPQVEGDDSVTANFSSNADRIINPDFSLDDAFVKIVDSFDEFMYRGSGWTIKTVKSLEIHVAKYTPLHFGTYIPTPTKLAGRKATLNIMNNDEFCFVWSVLAGIHRLDSEDVQTYIPFRDELDLTNISFPISDKGIDSFEQQNEISITVFAWDKKHEVTPYRLPRVMYEKHVHLLILSGEEWHFLLVKDVSKLLHSQRKHHETVFYCSYCLQSFNSMDTRADHMQYCAQHGLQKTQMPADNVLKFKNFHKQYKVPFIMVADFESILVPFHHDDPNSHYSYTQEIALHEPCGACLVLVSETGLCEKWVYRGKDCVAKFIEKIIEYAKIAYKTYYHIHMTQKDKLDFEKATICQFCKEPFTDDDPKVRHHNHIKRYCNYIGALHQTCNLRLRDMRRIPVFIHNARSYDTHFIVPELGKAGYAEDITLLPDNMEKYISYTWKQKVGEYEKNGEMKPAHRNIEFLDSLRFMPASLGSLVADLAKEGEDKFSITRSQHFHMDLLLRKGVYPYAYMTSWTKFNDTCLPPKEAFFNDLACEDISDDDYRHAQKVWETFQCQSMGDYHDLYLETDVLLLADVIQNFRDLCFENYKLDMAHYVGAPGLSWDAMLLYTGVEIELLTDANMFQFFERAIRGGITMSNIKHVKANNKYMKNYDATQPSVYISYLDVNNLYGLAMTSPLPVSGFKWVEDVESIDIMNIPDEGDVGMFLEVDLQYPDELHDDHDYPLCAEKISIDESMLSPCSLDLAKRIGTKQSKAPKLVPHLGNRSSYVIHYVNLKQALSLGIKLTKIHRAISFNQKKFMEPYIMFNTEKRKQATTIFAKNQYKLMNNSTFGKTMQNVYNRRKVHLVTRDRSLLYWIKRPDYKRHVIFSDNLVAVETSFPVIKLDQPIFVGASILDLSKTTMINFRYNILKPMYGSRAKIAYTDTDSFVIRVETDDLYQDMLDHKEYFDLSDFNPSSPFYDPTNKKTLGKMKDESPNSPIVEFIGLKPKMYSYLCENEDVTKKAKGVSKSTVKHLLTHDLYKQILYNQMHILGSMNAIRSARHTIYTVEVNKVALSPFDDKVYMLDEVNSLPHGHWRIREDPEMNELISDHIKFLNEDL